MIRIDVEGDGKKLQAPGEMTLMLSPETIGYETDSKGNSLVKLWSMNPKTGKWDFESDIKPMNEAGNRKKRQSTMFGAQIRGLEIAGRWKNLDKILTSTCYAKVRVYDSDRINQLPGANIDIVALNSGGNTVSSVRPSTDLNDNNGYCIAIPCKNEHRDADVDEVNGIIIASKYGERITPGVTSIDNVVWSPATLPAELGYEVDENTIKAKMHKRVNDENGPFYDWGDGVGGWNWRQAPACSYAAGNSFDFAAAPDCGYHTEIPEEIKYTDDITKCDDDRYKFMYSFHKYHDDPDKQTACFLKVHFPDYNTHGFQAVNKVGTAYHEGKIEPGNEYGKSEDCVKDEYSCLEIKEPGTIACALFNDNYIRIDDYTNVVISPLSLSENIEITEINSRFNQSEYVVNDQSTQFDFNFVSDMTNDDQWGIYCRTGDTIENARTEAKAICRDTSSSHWAVKFGRKFISNYISKIYLHICRSYLK